MNLTAAALVWAVVVAAAAFAGTRLGYSGYRFAIALAVAAGLFAFEFFLAVPSLPAGIRVFSFGVGRYIPIFVPPLAVLIYSSGVTRDWRFALAGVAYSMVPVLLLSGVVGKSPGAWQDYVAAIFIWLGVWLLPPYRLLYRVFPYPPVLTHTLSILMALSTAAGAFLLVRKMEGVGYAIEWKRGFAWITFFHFAVFAAIAIPLGLQIGFLTYDPELLRSASHWAAAVGILFFTAWPEEFLFRGVLQNSLARTFKNKWAGLAVASVLFGFSHILHAPRPNWSYVFLATIAGFFYGRAWMKSGSLVPGTLVHFLVDTFWHVLFR